MFKNIKTKARLKFAKWKIEKFLPNNEVEFVIAHFHEKINYLSFLPSNAKISIYNKGSDQIDKSVFKKHKNIEIINLPNVGRNPHTIFYHIIKNYNELSPITIFLPGSFNSINPYKTKKKFAKIVSKIVSILPVDYKGLYTSGSYRWWYHLKYFKEKKINLYIKENFVLDTYQSSNKENVKYNPSSRLEPAKIRPMENWYRHFFGMKEYAPVQSLHAMFGVKKSCILQHPIEKYKDIISQYSEINISYEIEHYLERLFPSIFMKL